MALAGLNNQKLVPKMAPLAAKKCVMLGAPTSAYTVRHGIKKFFRLNQRSGRYFDQFCFESNGHGVEELALENFLEEHLTPTLFVYDHKDKVVPYSDVERLQALAPNMLVRETDYLGHLGALYDHKTVNYVVDYVNGEDEQE